VLAPPPVIVAPHVAVDESVTVACIPATGEAGKLAKVCPRSSRTPAEVSRILGHSSITTTYRYIGVDETTIETAADLFDKMEEHRRELRKKRMSGAA
jgi:hypothetical protein